jgi:hypothetical protein
MVPFLLGEPEYQREDGAFMAAIRDGGDDGHPGADFQAAAQVDRVLAEVAGSGSRSGSRA